jgi:hypothetical protein
MLWMLLRACCRWRGLCRQASCEGATRAPRRILPLCWACEKGWWWRKSEKQSKESSMLPCMRMRKRWRAGR